MKKKIKILGLIIAVILAFGIWKYYAFITDLGKFKKISEEQFYFQAKIDSFYYKNLSYPNSEEYKSFIKEYFLLNEEADIPNIFNSIEFNDELIASVCPNESADTNNINFTNYLFGNYCVVLKYEKNLKNIYSHSTAYNEGKPVLNLNLKADFKLVFKSVLADYTNQLIDCDSTKNVHVKIGSNSYYTLLKGVKKNQKIVFSVDYSEFGEIEGEDFLIERFTKYFNGSNFNYDVDLIYIPFNFVESKNLICE